MAQGYRRKQAHRTAIRETSDIVWASQVQREAFQYGPYPLCLSGGYGSGKSWVGCIKMLLMMDLFPGYRVLIARKVWDELKKTTMATFFKLLPEDAWIYGGRRSDVEKILTLNNGSTVLWAHLDDPDTETMIQGIEINAFFIDQCEEVHEEIYEKLMGRLGRWDKVTVPPDVVELFEDLYKEPWPWKAPTGKLIPPSYPIIACNPDTKLHWIYRRFHSDSLEHWDRCLPNPQNIQMVSDKISYHDMGYRLLQMDSMDNVHLSEHNKEQLLARGDAFKERYVHGQWGISEGTIHIVPKASKLNPTAEVLSYVTHQCVSFHRALDHGDESPTCCSWFANDTDGNIFLYREYYRGGLLIKDHRRNIFELSRLDSPSGEVPRYASSVADPSIFDKTMQTKGGRFSVSDQYEDKREDDPITAIFWQKGDNDEMATRDRINKLLRVDPDHKHPITGEQGAPRLYFVVRTPAYPNGAYRTLQQTEAARRKKLGMYLGEPLYSDEREPSDEDHGYDTVRYHVATRYPIRKIEKRRTTKGTFKEAGLLIDRMRRQNSRRLSRLERREARRYGRL